MQLMPATAAAVAARQGVPAPSPEELFDPALSLQLGAAELGRLMVAFNGRIEAAVAAMEQHLDQCERRLNLKNKNKSIDLSDIFSDPSRRTKDV